MRGKLIVIEGTDCSGKETQSNLLVEALRNHGIRIQKFSFPNYQSPTGKIVGGPYLGKESISKSFFEEGPSQVDPKVASLYYAADRKYNIYKITWLLENGVHVLLDRYVYSNMAHQGGKIADAAERDKMYQFLDTLEFSLLELPRPDIAVFLHMPLPYALKLRDLREELDGNEKDIEHLRNAEKSYIELCSKFHFKCIECVDKDIKSIDQIHHEIYEYIEKELEDKLC